MLRIHTCRNAAAVKSYFTTSDYYVDGKEQSGVWGGKAADRLNLSGTVQWDDFAALADNLNPSTGQRLTARHNDNRRVAYDFTFSAPKSVTLLYEYTRDQKILDAFNSAIDATMSDMERESKTRVRQRGQDTDRVTGNMAWAAFNHFESRPSRDDGLPDPQMHRHVVAFNVTYDAQERKWKAGQFGDLKRDGYYWEAAFHARLSKSIADMGFDVQRKGRFWEVGGVTDKLRDKFSRRTKEVEALANKLGIKSPDSKAKLGATSRIAKNKAATHDDLRAYWVSRLTKAETAQLDGVVAQSKQEVGEDGIDTTPEAVAYGIGHMFERSSVVPERRVLAEALRFGVGGVTPESVQREANRQGLFTREVEGEKLASTGTVLDEESRMIAFARDGKGTMRPLFAKSRCGDTLNAVTNMGDAHKDFATLSPEQQAAIRHVWESRDRVTMIRGAAGTGKTSMMQAAVAGIDRPVTVLAPSAEASRGVLRTAGFASADTLARFLVDKDMQLRAKQGVIWVDEAGLIGSRDMVRLFDTAARLDARVILQGDWKQHGSVARGSPMRVLQEYAGVPVAELKQIWRQKGQYREAVKLIESGRVTDGFDALDKMGQVREVGDGERYQILADDYMRAVNEGKSALVVSPTHAEGNMITVEIRDKLKQAGRIGEDGREFDRLVPLHLTEAQKTDLSAIPVGAIAECVRRAGDARPGSRYGGQQSIHRRVQRDPGSYALYMPDTVQLARGDVIAITAGGKTRDGKHRLSNGARYVVAGFEGDDIRLSNGWVIGQDFGHFQHGYVTTSHASQGTTVQRVLIGQSSYSLGASNREQFYVSVSRGKESATIYTDDKSALRQAVQRSDPRMSATELVKTSKSGPFKSSKKRKLREKMRDIAVKTIDKAREMADRFGQREAFAYDR